MYKTFNYENVEIKRFGGYKTIKKVSIKRDKGYKSITKYKSGKKISNVKKPIKLNHLRSIKKGQFVVGLFNDCKNCKTKKYYKK